MLKTTRKATEKLSDKPTDEAHTATPAQEMYGIDFSERFPTCNYLLR